ncbi:hypothetical protein D3C73_1577580 [compost metagenome]
MPVQGHLHGPAVIVFILDDAGSPAVITPKPGFLFLAVFGNTGVVGGGGVFHYGTAPGFLCLNIGTVAECRR